KGSAILGCVGCLVGHLFMFLVGGKTPDQSVHLNLTTTTLPPEKVPNSYVGEKNKVFLRQKPLMNDELPQLAAVAPQPGVSYLGDWLSALMSVVLDNAGHSATRDISVEHNRQLGQIISQLKQENMPC
ncbi:virulence factor SrfC family protein, partial [Klebsiella pneumoniae]